MKNILYFVKCKKQIDYFGSVFFKKGKIYQGELVFDLLQFKGEKSFIQIDDFLTNEWFLENFEIYASVIPMEKHKALIS